MHILTPFPMDAMHLGMSDPEEVVVGKTPGAKIRKGTAKLGCSNSQRGFLNPNLFYSTSLAT